MKKKVGRLALSVVVGLAAAGCVPAIVGGGVFAVGVVTTVLISNCDEPASVNVWDSTSSHPICDAKVIAEDEDGDVTQFSPCYGTYLGTGVYKVTATKPGFPRATGTIVVSPDHRCSQPAFHTLDLTLGSEGAVGPPKSPPAPTLAPLPGPPSAAPPPPLLSAAPSAAPPAPAAPSSTVPSAAFSSAPPETPAPPTR